MIQHSKLHLSEQMAKSFSKKLGIILLTYCTFNRATFLPKRDGKYIFFHLEDVEMTSNTHRISFGMCVSLIHWFKKS